MNVSGRVVGRATRAFRGSPVQGEKSAQQGGLPSRGASLIGWAIAGFVFPLLGSTGQLLGQEPGSEAAPRPYTVAVSPAAMEIHQSGMLFDGHNDLPWAMREAASLSFDKIDIAVATKLHTDIPRLRQGGVKAQFWSVYVPAETSNTNSALLTTLEQIDFVHEMCVRYPESFGLALTSQDVERLVGQGKIASLIGMEGGHAIENSLQNLRRLYARGARYMTLTHSKHLDWADSCSEAPKHNGLTEFGREVVREMNRLGMLVDLSHVSPKTMHDALDTTKAPVIFSNSSARAICDHPRNVPDDVLARLPQNGGVVMVNFMSGFIVPTQELAADKNTLGNYRHVVDHIEHIVKVAGIDHVGIGSDYDGVERLPAGLHDVSCYPCLTEELLKRGYNREQIHKILGGNVLRVLPQAESVANEISRTR